MIPAFRTIWRTPLLFALAFVLGLGGLPLIVTGSATFLGRDVTSIAASVVGFYPGVAVFEVLRILGVAFLLGFGIALPFSAAAATVEPRWRRLIFPTLPLVAFGCWWMGAVLEYPALYETILSDWSGAVVLALARHVSPLQFYCIGLATLAVPSVVGLRRLHGVARPVVYVGAAATVAIFAASVLKAPESHAADPRRPNVLLIAVDSLRTDRLSLPGVAPNLHELLADPGATLFSDHYVGVPRTFPSWVEMLEGKYAAKTGVRHMFPGFGVRQQGVNGLAVQLASEGYKTTVLSDFAGDIFPRFEAGFQTVKAPKLTLMTMIRMSVDQMFPAFMPVMTVGPMRPAFPALKQSPAFADPRHLGEEVRAATVGTEPWLTTVFFSTAHFPYAAPYPYYTMFSQPSYSGGFRFQKNPEAGLGNAAADDIQQVRALYDGAVRSIDDELGRIFADLKLRGLWDSTVIVVTADHGEDLYELGHLQGHGEHLRGEHVLKVPFILKLAGGARPVAREVAATTRSIDLAATVAAAAGSSQTIGDGVNLMPWVTGARTDALELPAYAETGIWFSRGGDGFFQAKRLDYPGISGLLSFDQGYSGEIVLNPLYERTIVGAKHRTWISGDFKLIYMPTPRGVEYELYNRRLDPDNERDVSATEPERFAALKYQLLAFVADEEPPGTRLVDEFVVLP